MLFASIENGGTRKSILGFLLFLTLSITLCRAQSGSSDYTPLLGTWEGESKCTVPNSPCRDEHVVYEINANKNVSAGLKMDGYKVVSGERQFMGTLQCEYTAANKNLSCTSRGKNNDDWQYTLSGGTLQGTLTINAGKTLFRKITVKKTAAVKTQQ